MAQNSARVMAVLRAEGAVLIAAQQAVGGQRVDLPLKRGAGDVGEGAGGVVQPQLLGQASGAVSSQVRAPEPWYSAAEGGRASSSSVKAARLSPPGVLQVQIEGLARQLQLQIAVGPAGSAGGSSRAAAGVFSAEISRVGSTPTMWLVAPSGEKKR